MSDHIEQVYLDPEVFLVRVPFENISTSATNCYIVRDGVHAVVVDTGAPTANGARVLAGALDELGIDRLRAKWFLTHLHLDHAGLIDRIVPAGACLNVGAAEVACARASRTGSYLQSVQRIYRKQGIPLHDASAAARLSIEPELFDATRLRMNLVHEGDVIEVGRYRLRVIETPGHTPGHLSLFEPQSRILFGGDHALFVISPSIALFPQARDGLAAYLDSLKKVEGLAISKLFHSHGDIRADFAERLMWLGAHHIERLDETRDVIAACPGITGYQAIRSLTWNVPFDDWEDISFLQRWCIVTEGIVYLNHLMGRGVVATDSTGDGILRYRTV